MVVVVILMVLVSLFISYTLQMYISMARVTKLVEIFANCLKLTFKYEKDSPNKKLESFKRNIDQI